MYIEPNTNIRLLKGCPLDKTYEHTIYFTSRSAQQSYFSGLTKYNITDSTYQRVNKGLMKVNIPAERLYDCNYLMFQNRGFEPDRWFYAFIDGVEYVNDETSQVKFTLDVMQTWFFDYKLGECFVEREHSVTDVVGENTVPENLEKGTYITTNELTYNASKMNICLMATQNHGYSGDVAMNPPAVIGGLPLNCWYKIFAINTGGLENLKNTIEAYQIEGKADSIISIFCYPVGFINTEPSLTPQLVTISGAGLTLPEGVTVRNNKLKTYPFCSMSVVCGSTGAELRYELFKYNQFQVSATLGCSPSLTVIPLDYAGYDIDYSQVMTLGGYPLIPWTSNYYQNWIAQNKGVLGAEVFTGLARGVAGALIMSAGGGLGAVAGLGSIVSGASQIGNTLAEYQKNSIIPDKLNGSTNPPETLACLDQLGIHTYCRTIRPEYFEIIDDYFTKFGYATHRTKVPNTHSRPHWNYVKTISCTATGSVPADDMRKICDIYDMGITFWKRGSEIGNYSLNNQP